MPAYTQPLDIWNRSLQQCGAKRMASTSEVSVNASEVIFTYDKVRESELQRNTWKFAIKKTTLRALGPGTMLLSPTLWSASVTYYNGSIIADQLGNTWISLINNNLNNDPLLTSFWEPYYGPMAVPLYDTSQTTAYAAGEIVYTTIGNGVNRTFLSLVSGNVDDPLIPTIWLSTATYYVGQVVTFYPVWLVGTTYAFGAAVTRSNVSYVSLAAGNVGNDPATDNGTHWMALTLTTATAPSTIPSQPSVVTSNQVRAPEWNIATAYSINNIVVYNAKLYICGVANTGSNPASSGNWTVFSGGVQYQSLIDLNIDNEPDLAPALWAVGTTYSTGQQVGGSDGNIYQSVGNGNVGNNPITDNGVHWTNTGVLNPWTTVFVGGTGSLNWLQIGGTEFPNGVTLTGLNLIYPEGSGPSTQSWNKNVYRLPAGYLKRANQNPKRGTTWGGAPSGIQYDDWVIDGAYMTSWSPGPITMRFVANVTDVRRMDAMFCEGLASRLGFEIVERLTQASAKKQSIAQTYNKWMGEARLVNAIEEGWEDPPDDDLITCRY